jgi:hypothetical protein
MFLASFHFSDHLVSKLQSSLFFSLLFAKEGNLSFWWTSWVGKSTSTALKRKMKKTRAHRKRVRSALHTERALEFRLGKGRQSESSKIKPS